MKKSAACSLLYLLLTLALLPAPLHAEPDRSVNVGMGGFPRTIVHCAADIYNLEYEQKHDARNTLLWRGGGVNYHFDDGNYQETGRINGLDIGTRHYFADDLTGVFLEGALGYWQANWSFVRPALASQPQGTARTQSLRINIGLGDRIPIKGSTAFLAPVVNAGKFYSSTSCRYATPASLVAAPCNQKSEVTAYLFVGLVAGVAF